MTKPYVCVALLVAAVKLGSPRAIAAELDANDLAREIVHTQVSPAMLEELYVQAAQAASTNFQLAIQPAIKRAITDDEKQRLLLFWHDQMKDLIPYTAIEDMLVPIVTKNLSLEDLQEIRRFNNSAAGRRLLDVQSVIVKEARSSGEQLATRAANKDWQAKVLEDLKREFPQWFPAGDGKDKD